MTKPIIPWMGGKRRLAKDILPLIPKHTCYVEPFAGGAAIYFMKEPSKVEVLNDINGELVNLYRVLKHHLEEFLKQFKWALVSRQIFEWEKLTDSATLTDIQRAARFYYMQRNCFGAKPTNQTFGTATTKKPNFNIMRLEEDLSDAWLRMATTTIEHLSWDKVVSKYDRPETFFYLDPPYYGTVGYGIEFGGDQYELLAEKATTMKGKCIISINDHSYIRKLFKGLRKKRVKIDYTVGGATDKRKKASELILRNW